jgi:acrylyl-CoA reductase (NADPH)
MHLPPTGAPYTRRPNPLRAIHRVLPPLAVREQAWSRLARDLDQARHHAATTVVPLEAAIQNAQKLMAGQVRGRIVVETHG